MFVAETCIKVVHTSSPGASGEATASSRPSGLHASALSLRRVDDAHTGCGRMNGREEARAARATAEVVSETVRV